MKKLVTYFVTLAGMYYAGVFVKHVIDDLNDEKSVERGITGAGDTLVGDYESDENDF